MSVWWCKGTGQRHGGCDDSGRGGGFHVRLVVVVSLPKNNRLNQLSALGAGITDVTITLNDKSRVKTYFGTAFGLEL